MDGAGNFLQQLLGGQRPTGPAPALPSPPGRKGKSPGPAGTPRREDSPRKLAQWRSGRPLFDPDLLFTGDQRQTLEDLPVADGPEVEVLAAGKDGSGHLVQLGRGQG